MSTNTTAAKVSGGLRAILPLFLVIFIDSFGLGLIYPILNPLLFSAHHGLLGAGFSFPEREWLYGLTLGVFPLATFFSAPLLGDISDCIGRKKVLMLCLFGSFGGYLIAVYAIKIHSITWLIISRVFDGFTSGSQPIAQACIVDVSPKEKKAHNLSLMMLMLALGLVLGPLAGGFLSDPHWVSFFTYMTPLLFAAFVSFINIIWLWWFFKETYHGKRKLRIRLQHGIEIFISAFRLPTVRWLAAIFLILQFAWGGYFQFVSVFLLRRYGFDASQIGIFMGVLGLGFVVALGLVMPLLVRFMSVSAIVLGSLLVATIAVFVTFLPAGVNAPWLAAMPFAIACALAYTGMLTLFSNRVGDDKQGWVMGMSSAIASLAWGVMALLAGALSNYNPALPLWFSGALLVVCTLAMLAWHQAQI